MSKFCINCGNKLIDEARFCPSCGYKQPDGVKPSEEVQSKVAPKIEQPVNVENALTLDPPLTEKSEDFIPFVEYSSKTVKKKEPERKKNITGLIKSILLTTLSVLMFAMAFLPICKIEEEIEDEKIRIRFNAIDQIVYMFDSFQNKTDDEIENSNLYYKCEDLSEQYDDLSDVSNPEARKLYEKISKLTLRLMFQYESYKTNPTLIFSGLLSLAYLVISALLFIFAIFKLLFYLNVLKGNKNQSVIYKLMLTSLGLLICLTAISVNQSKIIKIGNGALSSFIAFGVTLVLIITLNAINREKLKTSTLVKRCVSLATSILVIVLCFSSIFSVNITKKFDSSNVRTVSTKIDSVFYDNINPKTSIYEELFDIDSIKDMTLQEKQNTYQSIFNIFLQAVTPHDVKSGKANDNVGFIIRTVLVTKTVNGIPQLFALTNLFLIFALITATAVLTQNIKYFMTGDYSLSAIKTNKILTLIFASIAFIINTIFIIFMNKTLATYLPIMKLSLTAGLIILLVFSVVTLAIPDKKKNYTLSN